MWDRLEGESDFEWKLRVCLAKKRRQCDLDWSEIAEMLNLDITPDQLRKVSVGYEEYDNYIHSDNGIAKRILSISDLHIPYELPIETFSNYVDNIDILQINGDVLDCQSISKFTKMYRISFMEELSKARQYLIDLINYINPKEKVVINYGNHDARMGRFLAKNLDNDIIELMPNNPLELIIETGFRHYDKRYKQKIYYEPIKDMFDVPVEYVDDWKVKIGKTWFVHPLAYRQGNLTTAEKAKQYFQDTDTEPFDTVVMAHTHKIGYVKIGKINLYEQGACCALEEMDYMDGKLQKPQQKGFVFIAQDSNGNLLVNKTKLIDINS
jgi:predicted phosphodiesterase